MFKFFLDRIRWPQAGVRSSPRAFRYAVLEHASKRRTFVKAYPQNAKLEFLRGEAIHRNAESTGLFLAPRPLILVESEEIIIWEHLDGLVELRDYLANQIKHKKHDTNRREKLFQTIGRTLAALHQAFSSLPRTDRFSPIRELSTGDPALDCHVREQLKSCAHRPLHWDFACGNLFVSIQNEEPKIVVLDAMPNHYVLQEDGPLVVCPIYIDVAQMLFSICCHPIFSRAIRKEKDLYVQSFFTGYEAESRSPLDRPTAFSCSVEVTRLYQKLLDSYPDQSWGGSLDRNFRLARCNEMLSAAKSLFQREQKIFALGSEDVSEARARE